MAARMKQLAEMAPLIADALETDDPDAIEDPLARGFRQFADAMGADREALAAIQRARVVNADVDASRVNMPTLVICGDGDVKPDKLAASIPGARAAVVTGDHNGAVADPAFTTTIVEFLAG